MREFEYYHPKSVAQAVQLLADAPDGAKPMAGGVDLLGEMKDYIESPGRVVNLKSIPDLGSIRSEADGLHVGPLALLTDVEANAAVLKQYAALAQAAASVGSLQIRNQGTVGGNLCQRPRCWYYRSPVHLCLKKGGDRCFSITGENKYNAILGGGPSYIVHPSDLAPTLIALNARVTVTGPNDRSRTLPLEEFYALPDVDVRQETVLKPGELVTAVFVPAPSAGGRSAYLKFKEKDSMDFALSAAAVALTVADGICQDARIVLGGVAPIPWRAKSAEAALKGKKIDADSARAAAVASTEGASPLSDNGYKVPLTQAVVRRAIMSAAGLSTPSL